MIILQKIKLNHLFTMQKSEKKQQALHLRRTKNIYMYI